MIDKLPIAYPPVRAGQAGTSPGRSRVVGPRTRAGHTWTGQAAKVTVAALIDVLVILGYLVMSLGIGAEGHAGPRPDRPGTPVMQEPAPRPGF
jgi:hypothetical protein